jgi:hypothetical protein
MEGKIMIDKVIHFLNGATFRYGSLLQDVVDNEEDYADAGGAAKVNLLPELYNIGIGAVAGIGKEMLEAVKIAQRKLEQTGLSVDTLA